MCHSLPESMMKKSIAIGSCVLLCGLIFSTCAELEKDLPPSAGTLKVHEEGWTDPTAINFHGKAIRNAGWDMRQCKTCHGSIYDGGTVNVSCRTCHNKAAGPENCTTCHGGTNTAPPRDLNGNTSRSERGVGAHQKHLLGGLISDGMACSDCHSVPPSVYTPGHVDSPLPAEVPINGFVPNTVTNETTTVDWDFNLPVFTPSPTYSPVSVSCSNTYCHGYFKNGNTTFSPVWTDTTGLQAACGTCHGDVNKPTLAERALPRTAAQGGTHPNVTACSNCHIGIVDANLNIIDKAKHINGKLNVFNDERNF